MHALKYCLRRPFDSDPRTYHPPASRQARRNIHRQRQHGGVEEERDHAVQRHQPSQAARPYRGIGGLRGRADRGGEIQEIPIVGHVAAGEHQPALGVAAILGQIIVVRVMQSEGDLRHSPGNDDGRDGKAAQERLFHAGDRGLFGMSDELRDGNKACADAQQDNGENDQAAVIAKGGRGFDLLRAAGDDEAEGEKQIDQAAGIPGHRKPHRARPSRGTGEIGGEPGQRAAINPRAQHQRPDDGDRVIPAARDPQFPHF